MMTRFATCLLCSVAPVALMAQQVDLRSPDEFISVEGEVVGFNGVMISVDTSVGVIAVPASEVICYGAGCAEILASNEFGLTADALIDVVDQRIDEGGTVTAVVTGGATAQSIGFDGAAFDTLYRTVAGAYAVAGITSNTVDLDPSGAISLADPATGDSHSLSLADDDAVADITIGTLSLNGTAPAAYATPRDWATTATPSHHMLGLKSFSVLVAPNAGISEISLSDLASVFAGDITNWSQIGGADMNVLPLQLPTNSDVWAEMSRLVMEPAGKTVSGNVLTMADQAGIAASILQFPGSVSIVETDQADAEVTVDIAGACGIAVAPTTFNILSGDYPLIRPAVAAGVDSALATELFDFAANDVAQGLVVREGFADTNAITQDAAIKNDRLGGLLNAQLDDAQRSAAGEMFQVLFDAERMSSTMTGGAASGAEGAWNRATMLDLVATISKPENQGREVIFVGLGQSTSGSEEAIDVSVAAAADMAAAFEAMAGDVLSAGGNTISSYGFGNVALATCVDGQVAGSDYTRIEVWLR